MLRHDFNDATLLEKKIPRETSESAAMNFWFVQNHLVETLLYNYCPVEELWL